MISSKRNCHGLKKIVLGLGKVLYFSLHVKRNRQRSCKPGWSSVCKWIPWIGLIDLGIGVGPKFTQRGSFRHANRFSEDLGHLVFCHALLNLLDIFSGKRLISAFNMQGGSAPRTENQDQKREVESFHKFSFWLGKSINRLLNPVEFIYGK